MAVNYILALLTICAIAHSSWAKFCTGDAQCPSFEICISNTCGRGYTGTGMKCNYTSQCHESSLCLEGECSCRSSGECPGKEICSRNGRCTLNYECYISTQCFGDQICFDHRCVYCSSHGMCPRNLFCINQKCVLAACRNSLDCYRSQRCVFGNCQYATRGGRCETTLDCPPDQWCGPSNYCKNGSSGLRGSYSAFIFGGVFIYYYISKLSV